VRDNKFRVVTAKRQDKVTRMWVGLEPGIKGEAASQMAILRENVRIRRKLSAHAQETFIRNKTRFQHQLSFCYGSNGFSSGFCRLRRWCSEGREPQQID